MATELSYDWFLSQLQEIGEGEAREQVVSKSHVQIFLQPGRKREEAELVLCFLFYLFTSNLLFYSKKGFGSHLL